MQTLESAVALVVTLSDLDHPSIRPLALAASIGKMQKDGMLLFPSRTPTSFILVHMYRVMDMLKGRIPLISSRQPMPGKRRIVPQN